MTSKLAPSLAAVFVAVLATQAIAGPSDEAAAKSRATDNASSQAEKKAEDGDMDHHGMMGMMMDGDSESGRQMMEHCRRMHEQMHREMESEEKTEA